MINPSLIEPSMFFFSIKAIHLLYKVFLSSDQKKNYIFHIGKDIKHAIDVDFNNGLPCPTPAALIAQNISTVVEATVVISSPSPIGFLVAVASTVEQSSIHFLMFF